MAQQDPQRRTCRVEDLTQEDIGRRVVFKRPSGNVSSAPEIKGRLIAIKEQPYLRGNMPRTGYELTIGFPSRYGGENRDTFGTLPAQHAIQVGAPMRIKPVPEVPMPSSPFPSVVKRVRAVFVGGSADATVEDVPVDEFFGDRSLKRSDPADTSIRYVYWPHGELKQVKGALWTGYWVLTTSIDRRKPWESATTWHKLPAGLTLPALRRGATDD